MTTKLAPADRKKQILDEAVRQAARVGYQNIKRADVAAALEVSPALVSLHFSTMVQLKRDVMRAAVATATGKNGTRSVPAALAILAQGLAAGDRLARKAPDAAKAAALSTLV